MLWLVGMGISGTESIPMGGAAALRGADVIYAEQFTSPTPRTESTDSAGGLTALARDIVGGVAGGVANGGRAEIRDAKRWMVEDGARILKEAESRNVVLLSYGDPLVATTHAELLCRAARQGIGTRVIHASSAPSSVVGQCGLHHYKMGRMATVMRDPKSMTTPYYTIYKNLIERCHTMLLLEYDREGTELDGPGDFFLEPADALRMLLNAEEGQQRGVVYGDTYAIVASRVGFGDRQQRIVAGKVSSLVAREGFGSPPHSVIIPGRLHFTEADALATLAECIDPPPRADGDLARRPQEGEEDAPWRGGPNAPARIAEQMVAKYAPMIRRSIEEVSARCAGDSAMSGILENARLYVNDAEDFIRKEGHGDVAVLSIGYADGLADALRLLKGLETGDRADEAKAEL